MRVLSECGVNPLRITLTPDSIQLTYTHARKEKADGTLPLKAVRERDRRAVELLRSWADALEAGEYDAVGFASDARTVRRDQLARREA